MSDRHDAIYKALADTHRRRMLASLCERPRVAGELAALVGLAPNAVSFHLKWLKSAGLVSVEREGKFLRYRANAESLDLWREDVHHAFAAGSGGTAAVTPSSPPADASGLADATTELLPTELL